MTSATMMPDKSAGLAEDMDLFAQGHGLHAVRAPDDETFRAVMAAHAERASRLQSGQTELGVPVLGNMNLTNIPAEEIELFLAGQGMHNVEVPDDSAFRALLDSFDRAAAQKFFAIDHIRGMTHQPNAGAQGGTNYHFESGWIVTVRGETSDPQALAFVSHSKLIRRISELMPCGDAGRDDEKSFLSWGEVRKLLHLVSTLDASGN